MTHRGHINYQYIVTDVLTDALVAEIPFSSVSWSRKVNAAGEFKGTIGIGHESQDEDLYGSTMPGKRNLYVFRNNVLVWGGIIWDRDYSPTNRQVSITALSFEKYMFHRNIWNTRLYVDATDIYNIPKDLVTAMNADWSSAVAAYAGTPTPYNGDPAIVRSSTYANLGITVGPETLGVLTSNTEDFQGFQLRTIGEAIKALSDNQDWFEFRIDCSYSELTKEFTKQLVLYKPEADGANSTLYFEYPGAVTTWKYRDTVEGAATRMWVTGAGDSDSKSRGWAINDTALSEGWPLIEEVNSSDYSTVSSTTTLGGYASTLLAERRPPIKEWDVVIDGSFSPTVVDYTTGDWAKFTIRDAFFDGLMVFDRRILSMKVSVPDTDPHPEIIDLELSNVSGSLGE